jgi:hypothetical protein
MEGNPMAHPQDLMLEFASPCGTYRVTFDDDGKVAYAYLEQGEAILGDVWLFNRCETPDRSEWSARSKLPFANCRGYMKDEGRVQEPVSLEDVTVEWEYTDERPRAFVYLFGDLVASLSEGEKPGFSRFASIDGPLAKRMVLEEQD